MTADLALFAAPLAGGGTPPEWVQLLPPGTAVARDGRRFTIPDPAAVVEDFRARGVHLPVDFEHAADNPEARARGPVPAAGWIVELRADAGGIWGRVEWTETAAEMIRRREYKYISPSLMIDKSTRAVLRLRGAGLVHHPALDLVALASEEDVTPDPKPSLLSRLAAMLDLDADASEDAVLAALAAALKDRGDPRKAVPVETMAAVLAERNAALALMAETRAAETVSAAMRAGKLSPAMRDWALALCRTDEAGFDSFVAAAPATYAHLSGAMVPAGPPPGTGRASAAGPEAEAVARQLGLKPEQLT
jgi:phage I-like protein